MRGDIDENGRAWLEDINAGELRTLFIAVELDAKHHETEASRLAAEARDRRELAGTVKHGSHANNRVAGELENEAAGHRAQFRDAADLARILRTLTTDSRIR